jgi:hypothetical protein
MFEQIQNQDTSEDAAALQLMRNERANQASQLREIKAAELEKRANNGVVLPHAAREAAHIAVQQVTEEFSVPVHSQPHETA